MKGIIFRAFESFVVERFGQDFYEQVLDATPSAAPAVFVGPGTYADAVLVALVQSAAALAGLPAGQLLHAFGRSAFTRLASTFPACLDGHQHPLTLLQSIDSIIHVEVRKLYPEAATPRIQVVQTGDDTAQLFYQSARRLCPVLVGLLEGACHELHYAVQHTHPRCLSRGDSVCEFALTFVAEEGCHERNAVATPTHQE